MPGSSSTVKPRATLVVAPLYHSLRGGLGRQAKMLTEALADRDATMLVATRRMSGLPRVPWHPRVGVARLRNARPSLHNYDQPTVANLWISLSFCLSLLHLLWSQRRRYDLVHFHGASLPLIVSLPLLRLLGKRCLAKVAGTDQGVEAGDLRGHYGPVGPLLSWIVNRGDGFVATTPYIAQALARDGVGLERIHLIPNMVDTEAFKPSSDGHRAAMRAQLEVSDRRVIVFSGRLVPLKQVDVLLEAFEHLTRCCRDAHLLIAGDGPERAALEALAARLGLTSQVSFLGFRRDMPAIYGASDLFCLPSRREGLPNALLEAMSCGLPIVASDLAGCRATISADHGLLVPPGDARSLSQALTTLLIDGWRRKLMGEATRHRILEAYGRDAIVGRYRELYAALRTGAAFTQPRELRPYEGRAGCQDDDH